MLYINTRDRYYRLIQTWARVPRSFFGEYQLTREDSPAFQNNEDVLSDPPCVGRTRHARSTPASQLLVFKYYQDAK